MFTRNEIYILHVKNENTEGKLNYWKAVKKLLYNYKSVSFQRKGEKPTQKRNESWRTINTLKNPTKSYQSHGMTTHSKKSSFWQSNKCIQGINRVWNSCPAIDYTNKRKNINETTLTPCINLESKYVILHGWYL